MIQIFCIMIMSFRLMWFQFVFAFFLCKVVMMEKDLKKRAPNYTNTERELLLNVIECYKHIIENKKTDGVSVKEKKVTWQKICEKFNTASPNLHYRPVDSLKKFYEKLKEDIRKRLAHAQKELYKTGGGTELKVDNKIGDELLMSIVNKKSLKGLGSRFDSNSGQSSNYNTENNIETSTETNGWCILDSGVNELPCEEVSEEVEFIDIVDSESKNKSANEIEIVYESESPKPSESFLSEPRVENNWKKAENLKTPISSVLQKNLEKTYTKPAKRILAAPSRRRPNAVVPLTSSRLGEKYETLIDKKLELVQCLKKEHDLRMQSLKLDILLKEKQLASCNISRTTTLKDSNECLLDSQILY